MKTIRLNVGKHSAVIAFKNQPHKNFDELRWQLIDKNLPEISTELSSIIAPINENTEKQDEK